MKKSEQTLEYYLSLSYPLTLYPDGSGFVAEIRDLPGCITEGETVDEALEMLESAKKLWLQSALNHGDEIPLPSSEQKYSGKLLVRMPRFLHSQLAQAAMNEGTSLNQYVVALLAQQVSLRSVRRDMENSMRSIVRQSSITHQLQSQMMAVAEMSQQRWQMTARRYDMPTDEYRVPGLPILENRRVSTWPR